MRIYFDSAVAGAWLAAWNSGSVRHDGGSGNVNLVRMMGKYRIVLGFLAECEVCVVEEGRK